MGDLRRAQILLEEEQHRALADIARAEGCSISELTREIIAQYLAKREASRRGSEAKALERARRLREDMRQRRGGKSLEIDVAALICEMREERDERILSGRG